MGRDILDLYSDYLLVNTRKATATGLSELTEGAISHDQITPVSCRGRTGREILVTEDKEAGAPI
jgi:hypothetical protein